MSSKLDALERLEELATKGPWRRDQFGTLGGRIEVVDSEDMGLGGGRVVFAEYDLIRTVDFDFIVAARNAMPALLRLARAVEDESPLLKRLRAEYGAAGLQDILYALAALQEQEPEQEARP